MTFTTFNSLYVPLIFLNFLRFSFYLTLELELQPRIDDTELPNYFKMQSSSAIEMVRFAKDFLSHTQKKKRVFFCRKLFEMIFEMTSLHPGGIDTSGELFGIS